MAAVARALLWCLTSEDEEEDEFDDEEDGMCVWQTENQRTT